MKKPDVTGGRIVKTALLVAVMAVSIIAVAMVGGTEMLPGRIFWPVAVIFVLLSAVAGFGILKFDIKQHKIRSILSIIGAVLLIVASVLAIGYSASINSLFDDIHEPDSGIVAEPSKMDQTFMLYISGVDTRTDEISNSSRSDVNIIIIVDPINHKILTVNTPRDYYLPLATFGANDKLTHTGIYGVGESLKTIENLYDIDIDYYARVNFNTLVSLVDIVGGVEVYSEQAFTTNKIDFVQGYNQLDGNKALAFSRARKQFEGGDRVRGQHQQLVIEAIFNKIVGPNTITKINPILDILSKSVRTNMFSSDIRAFIRKQIDDGATWQFEHISVDGAGGSDKTYSGGSQLLYVMYPDLNTVEVAKNKIAEYLDKTE